MAYLNQDQENFLIKFITEYIEKNSLSEQAQEMVRLDITGGLSKHAWREMIIEDVLMVAENHDVELTDSQLSSVVSSAANHDNADYYEYISYAIEQLTPDEDNE